MALTPWYVGNTASAWKLFIIPDSGVTDVTGLVPSSFSLAIRNTDSGVEVTGAGTFSNVTLAVASTVGGQLVVSSHANVTYQPASADVATIGNYHLYLNVTFGNGLQTFDLGAWEVVPR